MSKRRPPGTRNDKRCSAYFCRSGLSRATIEPLSKIASKNGFKQSDQMIIHLFLGSILLMIDRGEHPSILREKVTSKGGTTDAAIRSLISSDKFYKILNTAINQARDRSKKLN